MDFLNDGREHLRQAISLAIENHIPETLRLPLALALILMGSSYAINPELFQRGWMRARSEPRFLSREDYILYMRCVGVLLTIVGCVLFEFR